MTREEQLMKFWHETYLRPRSMALHLFPAKPAGFVRATQDLGNFASNASVARKARLEGKIQTANEYERIANGIYDRLPSYAKDVADAIDGGEIPSLPGRARHNPRQPSVLRLYRHHESAAVHAERAGDHEAAIRHHEEALRFAAGKPRLTAYHTKEIARLRGSKTRSNPVRTTRWLARQSERFYDARANKAVSEAIRLSRKTGTYDRLVAAYRANDPEAVAGILTFTRAVSDAFEGGGGYNLVRANAVSYVRAHMDRIGRLLAKAPQKPRSAVRSNPRGVRAIKANSVWELRRPTFASTEKRVYVTSVSGSAAYVTGQEGRVVFFRQFGGLGGSGRMDEDSFRRQYKPSRR